MKAKPVTILELAEWIKANEHRTWHWPLRESGKELTLEIKYLNFSLDTRDMMIWGIEVSGVDDIEVCDKEAFDGTILQLLEAKLAARIKERSKG